MKKAVALVAVVLTLGLGLALDAEAKRLGGGKSAGMQRQAVTAPAHNTPGAAPHAPSQAAPAAGTAAAAGAPAAAAAKRSWMGPVAGLAAGLGLAALASHFGFGEALANFMTMALIAMGVLLLVGFFLRRKAQAQGQGPALAGAGERTATFQQATQRSDTASGSLIGSRLGGSASSGPVGTIPAGFDGEAFVRNAKVQFLSLQAANDSGDLQRLREYLTPEMFDIVRDEIAERAGAQQATEVFGLQAQVLEVVEERGQYIASVRFTGSIREQAGAVPEDLDETWHLAKPRHGDAGWVIAGIQQA